MKTNMVIPMLMMGLGGLLLYASLKNKQPLALAGQLFGFATTSTGTASTGQATGTQVPASVAAASGLSQAQATALQNAGYYGPAF